MENEPSKNEYRCIHCNKLFFKGVIHQGEIEIKCRGCKNMNTIKTDNLENENFQEENVEEI